MTMTTMTKLLVTGNYSRHIPELVADTYCVLRDTHAALAVAQAAYDEALEQAANAVGLTGDLSATVAEDFVSIKARSGRDTLNVVVIREV